MRNYILNQNDFVTCESKIILTNKQIRDAINMANDALNSLHKSTAQFEINIFEVLGMRNLSGLVGEYFAKCVMKVSKGKLQSNPHQDGYPDLLLTDTDTKLDYFNSLFAYENGKRKAKDKKLFSPYKYKGLEVKACCGSTPSAKITPKPLVGEQRITLINSFDWKSHHRHTNNLLAILWDFIDETPTIVACFFQSNLTEDDWGKIVRPKDDGGRTTSVSIMNSSGIKKMCKQWVAVIDIPEYTDKLFVKKWLGERK